MSNSNLELHEAHVELQTGTYIDKCERLPSGEKYMSSFKIADRYWNYAYCVNVEVAEIPSLINEIRTYAKSINRPEVLYITPDDKPKGLSESLSVEKITGSVWMEFTKGDLPDYFSKNFHIDKLKDPKPNPDFLTVFDNSYGGGAPDSPGYTGLPSEYIDAISQCTPKNDVEVTHFVGYKKNEPVAISSIFCRPPYAGLYNVGTIYTARREKFGTDISLAALKQALESSCSRIFLQTIPDSPVEDLYKKIGFSRKFIGKVLFLDKPI